MTSEKMFESMKATVRELRRQYGPDICTDVQVSGQYAWYTVQPGNVQGYTLEVDLSTGESHHKGNGEGCFWTDWEQTY